MVNPNRPVAESLGPNSQTGLDLTFYGETNMTLTTEQILAAQKANVETLYGLTNQAFAGIEKLVALHLSVARAAMQESEEHAQACMSAKDAQEFLSLQAALLQPLAEKTAAYSRHLYDISNQIQGEFSKVAEARSAEVRQGLTNYLDNATQNPPAGTEHAVAFVKSAAATASSAFETVQKAVKQANDLAHANYKAAADSALSATVSAAKTVSNATAKTAPAPAAAKKRSS